MYAKPFLIFLKWTAEVEETSGMSENVQINVAIIYYK